MTVISLTFSKGDLYVELTKLQWVICLMTSFDYKYQNALRQAIVFSIFACSGVNESKYCK